MNKIILSCLLAFFVVPAFSQVNFGLKGGLNMANIKGTSAQEVYENRTGFHVGLFAGAKFQRIGIQPEMILSSQGTQFDLAGESVVEKFTYFNIPVMLKFYPVKMLNIQAGPQFGFLMGAKEITQTETIDVKASYKSSDVSLGLGLGLELPFGINLEGRYNLGLSDINDSSGQNSEIIKNQVFQISIGLRVLDKG